MDSINIDFIEEIKKLRPVTWIYKNDDTERRHIGYIAEEVYESEPLRYTITYDEKGEVNGISYEKFSVYLVEALKIALQKIENLEKRISSIENKQI
jgi:hypothetical protein